MINQPGRSLNSSHSSFILVDNPKGDEIDFRLDFERHIKTDLRIPMVLIVLEGGKGTLKTILGALKYQIPVILVAVSLI